MERVGTPGRGWLAIPACSMNRTRGQVNTLRPCSNAPGWNTCVWPPCSGPAHELNEFRELNLNFRKQWSAKKHWPFTSARWIPQGSCLLLLLQFQKWRIACYLFGPDFCCLCLHCDVTGCTSRPAGRSRDCPLGKDSCRNAGDCINLSLVWGAVQVTLTAPL